MKKSIKTVIGICLTLFFLLSVSTEAGKLKRSKVDFSQIKWAADDLSVELEKIEQYFNEVNNTGTFLKKSFSGKKFTWYYFDVDDDFSSENLVEETKKRTIRNIQLEKVREACWKVPIYLNLKPLFYRGRNKKFSIYGAVDLGHFYVNDNRGCAEELLCGYKYGGTDYYIKGSLLFSSWEYAEQAVQKIFDECREKQQG